MTTATATTPIIETETCTRCGGSGHYSYNQITGTTCFKCGGKGTQHTRRGKAVASFLATRLATDALSVSVGDRVKYHDALVGKVHTFTIADIIEGEPTKGKSLKDGVMVPWEQRSVTLVTQSGKKFGFGGAIPLRRVVNDEDRAAAIAYRDSLTLAGKPRKK